MEASAKSDPSMAGERVRSEARLLGMARVVVQLGFVRHNGESAQIRLQHGCLSDAARVIGKLGFRVVDEMWKRRK